MSSRCYLNLKEQNTWHGISAQRVGETPRTQGAELLHPHPERTDWTYDVRSEGRGARGCPGGCAVPRLSPGCPVPSVSLGCPLGVPAPPRSGRAQRSAPAA